jgi:Ser/Thr protein kinase RdoA (MazF antagonist)
MTVESALEVCYGLSPAGPPVPLPFGQSAVTLAVPTTGGRMVAKVYRPGADLAAERAAIELSEFAAAGGVPTAPLIRPRGGDVIARHGETALSLWRYVDGETAVLLGLDAAQMAATGAALGALHRRLAAHPAGGPALVPAEHLSDLAGAAAKMEALLTRLEHRHDNLAGWAVDALRRRRAILPRLARLHAELPPLSSQLIHGDLASPNVLFRGPAVAAFLDFGPPEPFLTAYDVTRIAFDPGTVRRADWPAGLAGLVRAYRAAHPTARVAELRAAARIWLCRMGASTYPLRDLLAGTGRWPDRLAAYARERHDAIVAVLDRLDEIDEVLRGACGRTI